MAFPFKGSFYRPIHIKNQHKLKELLLKQHPNVLSVQWKAKGGGRRGKKKKGALQHQGEIISSLSVQSVMFVEINCRT